MSRVRRSFVVATSEFLLVGMAAVVSATPGTGVSGTILAKGTSPNGIVVSSREKTDVAVLEITIAPGGSTGWHYHDGQVIAVVKSGTLTRTLHDCSTEVTSSRRIVRRARRTAAYPHRPQRRHRASGLARRLRAAGWPATVSGCTAAAVRPVISRSNKGLEFVSYAGGLP